MKITNVDQPLKTLSPTEYMEKNADEIRALQVDCTTCPVSMLCQSETGASGYTCKECRATSVYMDDGTKEHAYVIDCAKHTFPVNTNQEILCQLCDGRTMKHEYTWVFPWQWILPTVHSKMSVEARQKEMLAGKDSWKTVLTPEAQKKISAKRRTAVNPYIE